MTAASNMVIHKNNNWQLHVFRQWSPPCLWRGKDKRNKAENTDGEILRQRWIKTDTAVFL